MTTPVTVAHIIPVGTESLVGVQVVSALVKKRISPIFFLFFFGFPILRFLRVILTWVYFPVCF